MPCRTLYSAGAVPTPPRTDPGPRTPSRVGRRRWPRDGRRARVRALLSVANRDGIADLARELRALGVEMYATDGTREALAAEDIEVASVTDLTDGQTTVGGQVKTFHHAVYAGILARRDRP